jgi:HTH-type transcriptional regulator, glycine betaine synthesis regulator
MSEAVLHDIERTVVNWFVDGVHVLGLPKSLGEIYGLLFISPEPLALDDFVQKLSMSKGTASQGLKMLRTLGAIMEAEPNGGRRVMYIPSMDLKNLVGGFIREQIRPHLDSGKDKVQEMRNCLEDIEEKSERHFYDARIEKLDGWMSRGRFVVPMVQKLLGE